VVVVVVVVFVDKDDDDAVKNVDDDDKRGLVIRGRLKDVTLVVLLDLLHSSGAAGRTIWGLVTVIDDETTGATAVND